jgi:hypothetical protein
MAVGLPFHYLPGDSDRMLELLEAYRRACLWYWLTVRAPRPSQPRELQLVEELRSIRVIQLYDEFFRGPATWVAQWMTDSYGDLSEVFDDQHARQTLDRIELELSGIRGGRQPGDLDRFAEALGGGPLGDP